MARLSLQDNLVDADPLFVDPEKGNFNLKDESPAVQFGFKPIPIDKIGLYQSDQRASWPVIHGEDGD